MATFLFLVTLSGTTVLLIAIAAEEIARVTRHFFGRRRTEHRSVSPSRTVAVLPQVIGAHPSSHARSAAPAQNDWVPDRAA